MEDLPATIGIARRECPAMIVLAVIVVVDVHIDSVGGTTPIGISHAPVIMLKTAITSSMRRRRRLWRGGPVRRKGGISNFRVFEIRISLKSLTSAG